MQFFAVFVSAILLFTAPAFAASYYSIDEFSVVFARRGAALHPELSISLLACEDYRKDGQHCFSKVVTKVNSDIRIEVQAPDGTMKLTEATVASNSNGKAASEGFISACDVLMAVLTPQRSYLDRKRILSVLIKKSLIRGISKQTLGNIVYTLRHEKPSIIHLMATVK